jgi:ATP-binding cassette subfamily F protein uup
MIQLQGVTLSFGALNILAAQDFSIEDGERIALVGRNGAGKTSLMRLLAGEYTPDDGRIVRRSGLRCAFLDQEIPKDLQGSLREIVLAGAPEAARALSRFAELQELLAVDPENHDLSEELVHLMESLTQHDAWDLEVRCEQLLDQMDLDGKLEFSSLSGGMKRRALLARALVTAPDCLFLDEPTNHLDVPAIFALEEYLERVFRGALFFVTHDRAFLRRLATRIVELDRGQLHSYPGTYDRYLELRDERLRVEADQNALFDKRLAEEEAWIRQGVKARRTRNMGRVRALMQLRRERGERRNLEGKANLQIQDADRSGRLVLDAKNLSFAYPGSQRLSVKNLDLRLMRGDCLGILGPNGCGKTTLLRLLLDELKPTDGEIRHGTSLQVSYFDQLRLELDPAKTAQENLGVDGDFVDWNGSKRHVLSYLQDFLFTPDRARTPVGVLSGGERNRLLLARHFLKPANVMVMDEPTNDLDVDTLDLLQDLLSEWPGTLLIVSHDRDFLDQVVHSTLVWMGPGEWKEYVGGYSDWREAGGDPMAWRDQLETIKPNVTVEQAKALQAQEAEALAAKAAQEALEAAQNPRVSQPAQAPSLAAGPLHATSKKQKLSFKEQRELEQLPERIASLEAEQGRLEQQLLEPAFAADPAKCGAAAQRLDAVIVELDQALERWTELEERSS